MAASRSGPLSVATSSTVTKDLGKNNLFILQEDATLDEWRTLTPLLRWERSFRPSAP